jgi:hypothetical protein
MMKVTIESIPLYEILKFRIFFFKFRIINVFELNYSNFLNFEFLFRNFFLDFRKKNFEISNWPKFPALKLIQEFIVNEI